MSYPSRGQSVWFDTLSRDLVHTGELKRMMDEDAVVGVTSNPTIFQKALSTGDAYDDDLKQLLGTTDDATEIFFSLALQDIRDACDVLKPAYDASGGVDGYVSMEVEPGIAYDTEKTFEQVQWIAKEVDRPNLYVKIPATEPGLPAIEDSIAHGTSINITLIFSLDAVQGGRRGVPARSRAADRPRRRPVEGRSVASFFVSRVDYRGRQAARRGRPSRARRHSSRSRTPSSPTSTTSRRSPALGWEYLESKGAHKQRCLWASTSTKNPAYRDVMYVEELIGPETVNTMPLETIEAFQDHGEVRGDTVLEGVAKPRPSSAARRCRRRLRRRDGDARSGGRAEVHRLVRRDRREHRRQAQRPGRGVSEIVERIWSRDPTLWTGADEAQWLGWLDEPWRMREDIDLLLQFADTLVGQIDAVVLLGMGGSSLAPEVFKQTFGGRDVPRPRHDAPAGDPRPRAQLDLERTLFVSASKSGSTLETRSHTDYFWERSPSGDSWVAITDPGSAARRARTEAQFPRHLSRGADDRRPLLGAVAVRPRARCADGRRPDAAARPR